MRGNRYIHFLYNNYLKYGSDTPDNGNSAQIQAQRAYIALQRQKDEITGKAMPAINSSQAKMQQAKKKEIEENLNFIFENAKNLKKFSKDELASDLEDDNKAIAYFFKELNEILQTTEGVVIDPETLKAQVQYSATLKAYQNLANTGGKNNKKLYHNYESARKRINNIVGEWNQLRISKIFSSEAIKKIDQAINKIKTDAAELYKIAKNIENDNLSYEEIEGGARLGYDASKNLFDDIYKIQHTIRLGKKVKTIQGGILEALPDILIQLIGNKTVSEISNLAQDVASAITDVSKSSPMTGAQRTKGIIYQKNFGNKLNLSSKSYSFDGENYIQIIPTQDKVDITLQLADGPLNLSAKNTGLSFESQNPYLQNIKLLDGVGPLLYMQEYSTFIYDYLNIVSIGSGGPQNDGRYQNSSIMKQAHDVMKYSLMLKAIAGGVEKIGGTSEIAEAMLINDSDIGKIRVIWISDIFKKITENLNLIEIENWPPSLQMNWIQNENNIKYGLARTVKLLNDFNKIKLLITIKKDVIREFM